mgnify:CR=1 FL=1
MLARVFALMRAAAAASARSLPQVPSRGAASPSRPLLVAAVLPLGLLGMRHLLGMVLQPHLALQVLALVLMLISLRG